MKNKTKEWVICNRQSGEYYSDDQLSILPGLGEKTETKLSKYGINNLGDLVEMTIDGIPEDLMKYCRENRISPQKIHEFVNHAKMHMLVLFLKIRILITERLAIHMNPNMDQVGEMRLRKLSRRRWYVLKK